MLQTDRIDDAIKTTTRLEYNEEEYSKLKQKSLLSHVSIFHHDVKAFPYKVVMQQDFKDKIILHQVLKKRSKRIELFCCIVDIAQIVIFYFDHLDYIDNNFLLTSHSYWIRSILLGVSCFICN